MSLSRAVVFIAIFLGLSVAVAQQPVKVAACSNATERGTVNCPTYTVPAGTAVPHSMDGSMNVPSQTTMTLFNGAVPPNGFMIQLGANNSGACIVNDNGPVNGAGLVTSGGGYSGFLVGVTPFFATPPGYRPMGAVTIFCVSPTYVAARGW
jgi:hypothetical protein